LLGKTKRFNGLYPKTASGRGIRVSPRTITFFGAKGGVGVTTLVAESAALAAGSRVAAVDLSARGDLHYRLDASLKGAFTVSDLIPLAAELDAKAVTNALVRCPSGVMLLGAPAPGLSAERAPAALVHRLIELLGGEFELVVVDAGCLLDGCTAAAIGCSDVAVLVVTPDVSCVGLAGHVLVSLARPAEATHLVINRCLGPKDLLTVREIESYLGVRAAGVLPEDAHACRHAADHGRQLTGNGSALAVRIERTVRALFSEGCRS